MSFDTLLLPVKPSAQIVTHRKLNTTPQTAEFSFPLWGDQDAAFLRPKTERPANESQVGISRFQVRKKTTRSQTAERSKIETTVGQRGVQYEIRSAPVCLDKQLPRRSRYAGTCWQKPSCRPCKAFLRNAFCP